MPPPKKPQPSASEVAGFTKVLTARLDEAYAKRQSTGGTTVLRRLNRTELRNTLRDLLYLDGPDFRDPAVGPNLEDPSGSGQLFNFARGVEREFPEDEKLHGFDNIGQKLVMSDFLLKLVIGATEDALTRATHFEEKPKPGARRFGGHIRKDARGLLGTVSHQVNSNYDGIFERYLEAGAAAGGWDASRQAHWVNAAWASRPATASPSRPRLITKSIRGASSSNRDRTSLCCSGCTWPTRGAVATAMGIRRTVR